MMNSIYKIVPVLVLLSVFSCKEAKNKMDDAKAEIVEVEKEEIKNEVVLKELWATDSIYKTPESVLHDAKNNVLYVSNVNMNPWKKDENGFISKLSVDGKPIKTDWITGLSSPKGMGVYNDKLYVTDVDELIEIDIAANKISAKFPVKGATKLNDVSVDIDGTVYFTDMGTSKIHSLKNGKVETWKEGLNHPNGIFVEANRILIASSGDGSFKAYDKTTKEATTINTDMKSGDGLEATKSNNYVISNWGGEIFYMKEGKSTLLLDTKELKKQTADIGIIKDKNIVLVPTFFDNRVVAYKLEM